MVVRAMPRDLSTKLRPPLLQRRVPAEEVALFTRQFATMFMAGVGVHKVLEFGAHVDDGPLAKVLRDVSRCVNDGMYLSSALARHPRVFGPVYVGLIRSGENSGSLVEVLLKLADVCERQVALSKKIRAALIYPTFLIVVAAACTYAFLAFVLPSMLPLVTSLGIPLPWPTRVLVGLSRVISSGWTLLALLLIAISLYWTLPAARRLLLRRRDLKIWLAETGLRVPVLGSLWYKVIVARILFALTATLESGIPLLRCLELCRDVSGNDFISDNITLVSADLAEGLPFGQALARHEVLPRGAVLILHASEESISLTNLVRYLGRNYEAEVDLGLETATALIEPILMTTLGILAGFVAIATMLPLASLLSTFSS